MKVRCWEEDKVVKIKEQEIEQASAFCYLGSYLSYDSSCDKESKVRIGTWNAAFESLNHIWKRKLIKLKAKICLYDAVSKTTLLCAGETWPMTTANMKKLEAAHHKWLRRILGIKGRDKIKNEEIRRRTGPYRLEDAIWERKLRRFGHLKRIQDWWIPKQAGKEETWHYHTITRKDIKVPTQGNKFKTTEIACHKLVIIPL